MTYRITPFVDGAWIKRAAITKQPVELPNYKRYIPSFLIPGEFNVEFVAVGIKVTAGGKNWRFGGFLAQEFNFSSTGYSKADRAFFRTEDLLINNVTVLKLPVATDKPYRLRYFPPTWFLDLTLEIWEYTGTVVDGGSGTSPDIANKLEEIKNIVSVGFTLLNNRLDREDVPAKLSDLSRRLERIERLLGSDGLGVRLSSSSIQGKIFYAS